MSNVPAVAAALVCVLSIPASAEPAARPLRCEALSDGVEYRAYLPDQKRYVFVSVKAMPGYYPSVFVIFDKNFEAAAGKALTGDPLNKWWIDRSKPMAFSSDKVVVRWPENSTWASVTSWISTPGIKELTQTIRGLSQDSGKFVGSGATDTNTFAFESRMELTDSSIGGFDVIVPAVSYDGVTLAPPPVHFDRDGRAVSTHC